MSKIKDLPSKPSPTNSSYCPLAPPAPPTLPPPPALALRPALLDGPTNDEVAAAIQGRWRPNTRKAYANAWRRFEAFCAARGAAPLPLSERLLIDHASTLTSFAQLQHLQTALRANLRVGGADLALSSRTQIVLKDLKRRLRLRPPKQARALEGPALLEVITRLTLHGDPKAIRDRALFLVGWWGAMREGELAGIRMEDLTKTPYGYLITLLGAERLGTKTGSVARPDRTSLERRQSEDSGGGALAAGTGCPVVALERWLAQRGKAPGAVFCAMAQPGREMHRALDPAAISAIISRRCAEAGLKEHYSGHSLRAGLVTTALAQGIEPTDVMKVTRHKSLEMLLRYRRDDAQTTSSGLSD